MSGAALLIHDAKQLRLTFTCWLRRQASLTRAGQPRLSQRNKYERTNESQINIVSCKCWQHNARLTQLQSPQLPISSLCVPSSTYNKGSSHAVSYSVRRRADFWNIYYSKSTAYVPLYFCYSHYLVPVTVQTYSSHGRHICILVACLLEQHSPAIADKTARSWIVRMLLSDTHTYTHCSQSKSSRTQQHNTFWFNFQTSEHFKKWLLHVVAYANCVGHYYTALHRTQHTGKWLRKRHATRTLVNVMLVRNRSQKVADDFCSRMRWHLRDHIYDIS